MPAKSKSRFFYPVVFLAALSLPALFIAVCHFMNFDPSMPGSQADGTSGFLYCSAPVIDFGRLYRPAPDQLHMKFHIENRSSQKLGMAIKSFSCVCTTATLSSKIINPHGENELNATWKLADRIGRQSIFLSVADNAESKTLILSGVVELIDNFYLMPDKVQFGSIPSGRTETRTIRIFANPGSTIPDDFEIEPNGAWEPAFTASLKRISPVSYAMQIVAHSAHDRGSCAVQIRVNTHDPLQPALMIPVFANFVGKHVVEPEHLVFNLRSDKTGLQTLWIRDVTVTDSVPKIGDATDMFSIRSELVKNDLKIEFHLLKHDLPALSKGTVKLLLDEDRESVSVPYVILN